MKNEEITLRPSLRIFAERMELELRRNEHKGGWMGEEPATVLSKLWDEVYDLEAEVEKYFDGDWDGSNKDSILKEAADVANYAMFVADICLASMKVVE